MCCFAIRRFRQADVEFQLKKLDVVIDEVISQIAEKERLALEAFESGNTELFAFYNKSLEGLRDERKALREEKAKLLDAALVRKKEPSAGTFTLIAGCRPV